MLRDVLWFWVICSICEWFYRAVLCTVSWIWLRLNGESAILIVVIQRIHHLSRLASYRSWLYPTCCRRFWIGVGKTNSDRFVIIDIGSPETGETLLVDLQGLRWNKPECYFCVAVVANIESVAAADDNYCWYYCVLYFALTQDYPYYISLSYFLHRIYITHAVGLNLSLVIINPAQ